MALNSGFWKRCRRIILRSEHIERPSRQASSFVIEKLVPTLQMVIVECHNIMLRRILNSDLDGVHAVTIATLLQNEHIKTRVVGLSWLEIYNLTPIQAR